MQFTKVATYAVVLVLAAEMALLESFLVGARPFGQPLPVSAVIAGVANLLLGRAGGRLVKGLGAMGPEVLWFVIVFRLGAHGPGEDLIVLGNARGLLLLVVGAVGAVVGVMLGTTPARATDR